MKFADVKDKVLDVVDAVKSDPKKQLAVVGVLMFVVGFAFAKLF